jgi:hypothetical protein
MDGIKVIPASEVIESGSRKKSKPTKKSDDKSSNKSSLIITKTTNIKVVDAKDVINAGTKSDNKVNIDPIQSDDKSDGNKADAGVAGIASGGAGAGGVVDAAGIVDAENRTIKAIKLKESIYYGPNDINKKTFVKMYKSKKLNLKWTENINMNGAIVSCWTNQDRTQYIIKLLEEGGYKRFKFCGCDEIYNYFIGLGAIIFDYTKENSTSPSYLSNYIDKSVTTDVTDGKTITVECVSDIEEDLGFIGADLWSGYRTKQLLKDMPDNWGVVWK